MIFGDTMVVFSHNFVATFQKSSFLVQVLLIFWVKIVTFATFQSRNVLLLVFYFRPSKVHFL